MTYGLERNEEEYERLRRQSAYDVVIVGAGSAGCVLAARLTEDPDCRVLLLEAGPPDSAPEIAMPGAFVTLFHGPYAWEDATTAQPHADGRSIPWPHGRTLGGSSAINGMVHIRGNRVDYDAWRHEYGCDGWGYDDLVPYFAKAEEQLRPEPVRYVHELSAAWLESALAYGLPANDDFNGDSQDGAGFFRLTQRGGRRNSVADAYLRPALERDNLTVMTDALVTRVLVHHGRATGVRFGDSEVRAGHVVLSAGAINTPRLLLRSGIDAPGVGRGLQDHPLCILEWSTPDTPNLWEEATPENLALWQRTGEGPFASSGAETVAFARSRDDAPAPDLLLGPLPGPAPDDGLGMPDRRAVGSLVMALDVRSRGRITLDSIDPGYLTERHDLDALATGVRLTREIVGCEPLARHTAAERAPGDHAVVEWIRANVATAFHPACSCAMGGADDAVCDPDLRVRGVNGLSVVDASVMPKLPRGNTNAPTIAIAERAADLMRA